MDRKEYYARYRRTAKGKAAIARARARYKKSAKGRANDARYKRSVPGKIKARSVVNNAKRDGKIKRSPCAKCGAKKVEAHHPDYRKPLVVVWLCKPCHTAVHAN